MADYPEHEKMKAVKDRAEAIGGFLEWAFHEQGYSLRTYEERPTTDYRPCRNLHFSEMSLQNSTCCDNRGWREVEVRNEDWHPHPTNRADIQKWLADYLGIDLAKIEDEKRQMLDELREMNA